MELPRDSFATRRIGSRMRKNLFGIAGLMLVCTLLTGCTAVQNYSIRSYQGPLPMADYQNVHMESYGVPVSPR